MTIERLLLIVKESLGVNRDITIEDSMSTIDEWDSLNQLEILVCIDKETDGKAANIRQLASALSVKEIVDILRENGLIDG